MSPMAILEEIFQQAVDLPPQERAGFLRRRCAGDDRLRAEVQTLLDHDLLAAESFLQQPPLSAVRHPAGDDGLPARVGRYQILRKIGEGGMGIVYEARQDDPQRTVALKIVRPGWARSSLLRRFRQEALVLGQLQHPGIACIYEADTARLTSAVGTFEQPYFAMELIRGETVTAWADARKLDLHGRLRLIEQVCEAVEYAHAQGVIHRDLKPANILVDESGRPRILDFGVARVTVGDRSGGPVADRSWAGLDAQSLTLHTDVGQIVGTLSYMSPEQMSGDPDEIDGRCDVYSLGVILYELLTGRLPHDVRHCAIGEAARIVREEEPSRLSTINTLYRGDIETIVAKAIEKDRQRRYPRVAVLAEDLRRFLRHEPIVARPPRWGYRLHKFARRNAGLVAGLAAAFVMLVLALIGTSWGLWQASQQRDQALNEAAKALAMNDFLVGMLRSADPRLSSYSQVTVQDVLDQASNRVKSGALADQPQIEANVRSALGTTYMSLGLYPSAGPHLERALALRRGAREGPSEDLARSLNELGELRLYQARNEEAESLLNEALQMRVAVFGERHAAVAATLNNLAEAAMARDDATGAEALLRRALAIVEDAEGEERWVTANVYNNLAVLLRQLRRYDEAEDAYRAALPIHRDLFGDGSATVAATLNNLGLLLAYRGEYERARPLYEEALAIRRQVLGDTHPEVATSLNALGGIYDMTGDTAAAEDFYRRALDIRRLRLPKDHPALSLSLANLASALLSLGRLAEAETAERESLEIARSAWPAGHPEIGHRQAYLGRILLEQGRWPEAEENLRQGLEALGAKVPPGDWERNGFDASLGAVLVRTGRLEEAEPVLRACYQAMSRDADAQQPWQREWRQRTAGYLVELYTALGRPEETQQWQQRAGSEAASP